MTPPIANDPPAPAFLAGFLSFLVPGLGQIVQGRVGKGLMFMGILLGMFFLGQAMGDWRNVFMPEVEVPENAPAGLDKVLASIRKPLSSVYNRWHFAGQFWIGVAAWPAIWQFYNMPMPAQADNEFWHRFQRPPNAEDERQNNEFITDTDKAPDLGWVYTVVAGMLNILVIYDAAMGPALIAGPRPEDEGDRDGTAKGQPASAQEAAS